MSLVKRSILVISLKKQYIFFLPKKINVLNNVMLMSSNHVAILNTGCPYLIRGIIIFNVYTGKFATREVIVE